jgi:hypothetical protein
VDGYGASLIVARTQVRLHPPPSGDLQAHPPHPRTPAVSSNRHPPHPPRPPHQHHPPHSPHPRTPAVSSDHLLPRPTAWQYGPSTMAAAPRHATPRTRRRRCCDVERTLVTRHTCIEYPCAYCCARRCCSHCWLLPTTLLPCASTKAHACVQHPTRQPTVCTQWLDVCPMPVLIAAGQCSHWRVQHTALFVLATTKTYVCLKLLMHAVCCVPTPLLFAAGWRRHRRVQPIGL